MRIFTVTYNEGIGMPYKHIQVNALNTRDAENEVIKRLGNVRIVSVRG